MNDPIRTAGLWQRLRSRPAAAAPDAADLGTCFGLEISLGPAADALPAAPARRLRAPGWVQRLTSRPRLGG